MLIWRLVLSILGVLVLLYGLVNLGLHIPGSTLVWVAVWLVAAVVIHHGVISPVVIGISVLLRRLVPDRGRSYLQAGLIAAVPVTVIGIPMIYRHVSQPPRMALCCRTSLRTSAYCSASLPPFAWSATPFESPGIGPLGRRDTPST